MNSDENEILRTDERLLEIQNEHSARETNWNHSSAIGDGRHPERHRSVT